MGGFVPSVAGHEANHPRAEVIIDGTKYRLESYSIETNAHGATNTAHVTLPIKDNPDFTFILYRDINNPQPVTVVIRAGFNGQFQTRFSGIVDQYVVHTDDANYSVEFQCRSAASVLVDNKITSNAIGPGLTSVQFLQQQCNRFGLKFTPLLPGGYQPITIAQVFRGTFQYGIKNIRIWDLAIQCAQFDDADLWEENGTVYYAAPNLVNRNTVTLKWLQDVESIEGIHAPNFNRNVEVVVRTYKPTTKQSSSARIIDDGFGGVTLTTASRTVTSNINFGTTTRTTKSIDQNGNVTYTTTSTEGGSASGSAGGSISESKKERYVLYVPNQDAGIAQNLANNLWRNLSMHEYSVTVALQMTEAFASSINIRSYIQIANHPYILFNDKYWPRRLTEDFDTSAGWRLSIEAVNHVLPPGTGGV